MSPRIRRRIAHFNRRVTNHLIRPLAMRLTGFGVLIHTGRSSSHAYRTPVNVFRAPDGYVIALTHGTESDCIKNVLASGGCQLVARGRRKHLSGPEMIHDEARRLVPWVVRPLLRALDVSEFMHVAVAPDDVEREEPG